MNFKIEKDVINKVLQHLSKVIGVVMILPIYKSILINVKDGKVTFIVSDGTISMLEIVTDACIYEDGVMVVDGKLLCEIVRKADKGILWIRTDKTKMIIKNKSSEFSLNTFSVKEYPNIDFGYPETRILMNTNALNKAVINTIFSASDQQTRPVLGGLNFALKDNVCIITGTDSYRLSQARVKAYCENDHEMTIPKKMLSIITTVFDDEEIAIYFSEKKAMISTSNMILQSALLEGVYPDVNKLIPSTFQIEIKINKDLLLKALDRTSFNKQDGTAIVCFELLHDEIMITSESKEIGTSLETLPIIEISRNEPVKFYCNQQYFFEAVSAINDPICILHFISDSNPFILTGDKNKTDTQLLLPVRHN